MYQILIIDDDPNILTGLCDIVRREFPEHLLPHSYQNSREALDFIDVHPVDIIITDIKMPQLSGIDLLRALKERQLSPYTLVLSGYDDYALVRSALKLGAFDYLLKPVDIGLLKQNLSMILQELSLCEESTAAAPVSDYMGQLTLEAFFISSRSSTERQQAFLADNGLTEEISCARCYVDIKYCLHSTHLSVVQYLEQEITAFAQKYSKGHVYHYLTGILDGCWCLLVFTEEPWNTFHFLFTDFLNKLKEKNLHYYFPENFVSPPDLKSCQKEYLVGLEKYFYDFPAARDYKTDADTERLYTEAAIAFCTLELSGTMERLSRLFAFYNDQKTPVPEIRRRLCDWIYLIMEKDRKFISLIGATTFSDHDIFQHIDTADRLSVLYKLFYQDLCHILNECRNVSENKDEFMIKQAKQFIQDHYKESLGLSDVAAHVCLNANYFSQLFQTKTGTTFRLYLRKLRMDEAKQLLKHTHLKVYEIALQVGYSDSAHFTRAFKEYTGMSPNEYRNI